MTTYIALLRGINVGKAKRIAMADLRALLEDLGYTDVVTLLNSGNVVFKAGKGVPKKLAADISAAIATHLGIEVPVIVVSTQELALIVGENTFGKGLVQNPFQLEYGSMLLLTIAIGGAAFHAKQLRRRTDGSPFPKFTAGLLACALALLLAFATGLLGI